MKKVNLFLCAAILIVMSTLTAFIGIEGKSEIKIKINEVKIGNQIWMVENLNVDKFQNGDLIPEAKTNEEWKKAEEEKKAAWCYYNNDPANGSKYGKLYNYYAIHDKRRLAPSGWHIPIYDEWRALDSYLGDSDAGKKMKSNNGWNGTNESGFTGLPGGYRFSKYFLGVGEEAHFWSATSFNGDNMLKLYSLYGFVNYGIGGELCNRQCSDGGSVRCVKD